RDDRRHRTDRAEQMDLRQGLAVENHPGGNESAPLNLWKPEPPKNSRYSKPRSASKPPANGKNFWRSLAPMIWNCEVRLRNCSPRTQKVIVSFHRRLRISSRKPPRR